MSLNVRWYWRKVACMSVLPLAAQLHAQVLTPQVEQALRQTQSEISRLRVPQPLPDQKELDLWVKPPDDLPKKEVSEPKTVDLTKVRVVGSTYLKPEQVNAVFEPLQGRKVELKDLQSAAEQLQRIYRDAGYFLTRVFVPLQQVAEGGFEIRVVEGYVSAVVVEGTSPEARLQIQEAIQYKLLGKKPLSLEDVDSAKDLIKKSAGAELEVKLKQGKELGAFEFVVSINSKQSSVNNRIASDKLPALPSIANTPAPAPILEAESQVSRLRVPQPLPEPKEYEIFIQQTEKTPVTKAVDELMFDLIGVRVEGSSYFSQDQVNAMFAHLVGKKVSVSDLRGVAEQLETQYREAGFFLTRVFLPPQQVKNGVFEIRVIEGYVTAGFAEGGNDLTRERMERLLNNSLAGKKPLSLATLERTLLIANEFPGYAASSMLRQGSEIGTSELVATMIDVPGSQSISVNNNSSKVTGPWSFAYSGMFNNKLGRGEQISVGVNAGNDFSVLKSVSLKYAEPLGSSGLIGSFGVLVSEAHPAGSVAALNIASVGSSMTPRLRYPLMRSRDSSVYVETGLTVNQTETTIAGAALTLDQFTVWDANAAWLYKSQNLGAGNVRLAVSKGVPYFGAMGANATNPSVVGFESQFIKWTYGVQHTFPISALWSLQVSMNGQVTSDTSKLLSGEQISFGGAALGRGYDGGAISGDSGLGGLVELRYELPYRNSSLLAPIQAYVFADVAEVNTHANRTSGSDAIYKAIASQGFGARFVFVKNITLDLQFANAAHYYPGDDTRPNPRLSINTSIAF